MKILLFISIDDSAPGQVVRRDLHQNPVPREDADKMKAHLSRNVGEYLVSVIELHLEHRVWKRLDYFSSYFYYFVFIGHAVSSSSPEEAPDAVFPGSQPTDPPILFLFASPVSRA